MNPHKSPLSGKKMGTEHDEWNREKAASMRRKNKDICDLILTKKSLLLMMENLPTFHVRPKLELRLTANGYLTNYLSIHRTITIPPL